MDGSYLTNEAVIEASRNFVCIRTATYEDEEEADFLRWVFSRNDNLENTVFTILSPDGARKLIRGNRGPMQFRRAFDMADKMDEIASEFKAGKTQDVVPVPRMKNVRLGLNVAACDRLPTFVVMGENEEQVSELRKKLSPLAWDAELLGVFIYCDTADADELENIKGLEAKSGFAIVEPDDYGLEGKVISQFAADASPAEIRKAMLKIASDFQRPVKNHNSHVRSGKRNGIDWETEIPVEDPMALRAQGGSRGRR